MREIEFRRSFNQNKNKLIVEATISDILKIWKILWFPI